MPFESPNYQTLSAMITPALFMTANGSLIISTSNRMSRVVDRIRVLNELGDSLCRGATSLDFLGERYEHLTDQLRHLEWRSDRVRYALSLLYLSFVSFVGTSLTLALDVIFGNHLVAVPTLLAVLGVVLMMGACFHLVREAHRGLLTNRLEIRFYRALHERRKAEGTGCESA
jgi:hypothetical protein